MRTIVHLSDVHFGRVDTAIVEPLVAAVHAVAPDVVVVSGDLTQRAKPHQFEEARRFLDALPDPQIVVPGNHDVPLYDVTARFFSGLGRYRRYISDELMPFHIDEEIAVVGVNTARSLTFKGGRINRRQVLAIRRHLCPLSDETVKIVVTHHPFDLPGSYHPTDLLGRAPMALRLLAECGADLFLAGHMHVGYIGSTAARYKIDGYAALVIQAGTATSTRGRGEPNSFNIIRTAHPLITVERLNWQPETLSFSLATRETYRHTDGGWQREESSGNAPGAAE
jgi:3',5'-cyclic AMP phosphodiesterase CpdA